MREQLQPAPPEVLDEFDRVSERFQTEFDIFVPKDVQVVTDYFKCRGLSYYPTIHVPNTKDGYQAVRAVANKSRFPHAFLLDIFDTQTDFSNFARAGTGLSVPAYKLNFLVDVEDEYGEMCGEDVAWYHTVTTFAHENTHSAIYSESEHIVDSRGGNIGAIYKTNPLTNVLEQIFGDETYKYQPLWIEEAAAGYISADVFHVPLQTPDNYGELIYDEKGPIYALEEQYLLHSSRWPEYPGEIGGALAGQTLQNLNRKVPGTVDGILGIAKGEVNRDRFRYEMKRKIGPELFALMFKPQPYTCWLDINKKVEKL